MKLRRTVWFAVAAIGLAGCGRKDLPPPISEKEIDSLTIDVDTGVESGPPTANQPGDGQTKENGGNQR